MQTTTIEKPITSSTSRKRLKVPAFDYLVLMTSLLLMKLPAALGYKGSIGVRALFLLPLVIVTVKNIIIIFLRKEPIKVDIKLFLLYLFFILIVVASFIRALIYRTLPSSNLTANFSIWFISVLFSLSLFISARSDGIKFQYRLGLVWICVYYFGLNYLMYILGIGSSELSSETVLLRALGITTTNRILFPTADGVNYFGVTTGAGLVALSIAYWYGRRFSIINKFLIVMGISICLMILLLTDARGAFGICLIVVFLALLLRNRDYRLLTLLPVVSPFLPFLLLFTSQSIPSNVVKVFSRNISDFQTLNGRVWIWQRAIERIRESADALFTGFGYRGQFVSGLSNDISLTFGPNFAATAGTHNYLLQWLMETGIIGATIFLLLLTMIIYKLSVFSDRNRDDISTVIMLFILVYCIVAGTQDTVLTIDYEEVFTIFSIICAGAITLPRNWSKKLIQLKLTQN